MTTALAPLRACPHIEDMDDTSEVLRKALDAAPGSTRELARAADVSPRLLRLVRDGDRRLTAATRDGLAAALRRWEERCGEAAEALERCDLEPGGDDG